MNYKSEHYIKLNFKLLALDLLSYFKSRNNANGIQLISFDLCFNNIAQLGIRRWVLWANCLILKALTILVL